MCYLYNSLVPQTRTVELRPKFQAPAPQAKSLASGHPKARRHSGTRCARAPFAKPIVCLA